MRCLFTHRYRLQRLATTRLVVMSFLAGTATITYAQEPARYCSTDRYIAVASRSDHARKLWVIDYPADRDGEPTIRTAPLVAAPTGIFCGADSIHLRQARGALVLGLPDFVALSQPTTTPSWREIAPREGRLRPGRVIQFSRPNYYRLMLLQGGGPEVHVRLQVLYLIAGKRQILLGIARDDWIDVD